jgi:hypothetical protein
MAREMYRKAKSLNIKILPCPFCGSESELWEYSPNDDHHQKVVMCSNAGDDEDQEDEGCPMYMPPEGFYMATKREAVAIWNKRDSQNCTKGAD